VEKGLKIEEGIMSGVGESPEDIADSVLQMGLGGARQMRVMSFVPRKGSPMEEVKAPDRMRELKTIAILRLLYPGALIPASLDVEGISGLRDRIDAGANLVTSIIPPKKGLSGVAKSFQDVDDGGRTVNEVSKILESMNLRIATNHEYNEYLFQ
jgi:methylornithine synthase